MSKHGIFHTPPGLDIYQAMSHWSADDAAAFMARMMDEGVRKSWSPTLGYSKWGAPVGWDAAIREKYIRLARETKTA